MQTDSVGGTFTIYSNAANYNPTLRPAGAGVNLPAVIYPGITSSGTVFLSGVFAPGAIVGDDTTTYTSFFNTRTFAGNGQGFIDFTGGIAQPFFDTDSLDNGRDAFLTVTFDNINGAASRLDWTVKSSGQISGLLLLPEPDSLALFALGLLALGTTARRSSRKG